ncbi:MAG TPA: hypothetical protein VMY40_15585 [Anaerolineae bacterium]|nr:hypothetical protein [Anaerolineae bacterium]
MNATIIRDCIGYDGKRSFSISAGTQGTFLDWIASRHPDYPKGIELVEIEIEGRRMAVPAFAVEVPDLLEEDKT